MTHIITFPVIFGNAELLTLSTNTYLSSFG